MRGGWKKSGHTWPLTTSSLSMHRFLSPFLVPHLTNLHSSISTSWSRTSSLPHTGYTTRCCDLLERSTNKGDRVLAWLVRLQHVVEEIGDLRKNRDNAQSEYQLDLMLRGMDAQLTEWEGRMAPDISSNSMSPVPPPITEQTSS